jgi:hypothetical protein
VEVPASEYLGTATGLRKPQPLSVLYALVNESHEKVGREAGKLIGGYACTLLEMGGPNDSFIMDGQTITYRVNPVDSEFGQNFLVLHVQ